MKKTLLATIIASTLALTACGGKDGKDGKAGAQGAQGAQGDRGPQGPAGAANNIANIENAQITLVQFETQLRDLQASLGEITDGLGIVDTTVVNAALTTIETNLRNQNAIAMNERARTILSNIAATMNVHFEALEDAEFITNANNQALTTAINAHKVLMAAGADVKTLAQINTAVDFIHRLVRVQNGSANNATLARGFQQFLNAQYAQAATTFESFAPDNVVGALAANDRNQGYIRVAAAGRPVFLQDIQIIFEVVDTGNQAVEDRMVSLSQHYDLWSRVVNITTDRLLTDVQYMTALEQGDVIGQISHATAMAGVANPITLPELEAQMTAGANGIRTANPMFFALLKDNRFSNSNTFLLSTVRHTRGAGTPLASAMPNDQTVALNGLANFETVVTYLLNLVP